MEDKEIVALALMWGIVIIYILYDVFKKKNRGFWRWMDEQELL